MIYKKKSTIVEAVLWDGTNKKEVLELVRDQGIYNFNRNSWFLRSIGEEAIVGEYIIRELKGEIYKESKEEFNKKYKRDVDELLDLKTRLKNFILYLKGIRETQNNNSLLLYIEEYLKGMIEWVKKQWKLRN